MEKLFSPLQVKNLELANRIVFPPMANNLAADDGKVTQRLFEHYAARADQVGLIIVEHSYVNPTGRINNNQLGIHTDDCVAGLTELVEVIHNAGSKCGIQITHAGGAAKEEMIGQLALAPSAISHPRDGGMPREISISEIAQLIEDFATAARRAKQAGFDMVEIHGAHGYLLNQFLSPYTNQRGDQYGGSLANRLRLPLEVLKAVRAVVGPEYPVFYRLGADDGIEGGLTAEEGAKAAVILAEAGVDTLDLSGGLLGFRTKSGQGFFVYLAEKIKPLVKVPVLVTGGITTPELAEKILSDGTADLVGIGRALNANPNWAVEAAGLRHQDGTLI